MDRQGRGADGGQSWPGKIGADAARDDRRNRVIGSCSGEKCRCGAGTGAEIADHETGRFGLPAHPGGRHQQTIGEKLDVEDVAAVAFVGDGQPVE